LTPYSINGFRALSVEIWIYKIDAWTMGNNKEKTENQRFFSYFRRRIIQLKFFQKTEVQNYICNYYLVNKDVRNDTWTYVISLRKIFTTQDHGNRGTHSFKDIFIDIFKMKHHRIHSKFFFLTFSYLSHR
jgi:hypothetical protein